MSSLRGSGLTSKALTYCCDHYDKFIYVVPNRYFIQYCKDLMIHLGLPIEKVKIVGPEFINDMTFKGLREPIVLDHVVRAIPDHVMHQVLVHNSRFDL